MRRSRLSTAARIVKRHRRICSNASLAGYRIPSILDVPAILENEAVVRPSDPVHSARPRVGDSATFGVSPAIANAIDDAVGVHLSELPLNAESSDRPQGEETARRCVTRRRSTSSSSRSRPPHHRRGVATGLIRSARVRAAARVYAAVAQYWSTAAQCQVVPIWRPSSMAPMSLPSNIWIRLGSSIQYRSPSSRLEHFTVAFCTPGFGLMAKQLLERHLDPDDDEIRHYLSGNLCRCGAYRR